ncbi:MAG: hypothetical protein NTV51_30445 [Verrucomicrobia bacterium]|nr:hypothetical protein [Verrucomicrobiota bacterium]
MSKLTVGLIVVVAGAGGAAIYLQQQSIARLRGEMTLLHAENVQLAKQQQAVVAAKARETAATAATPAGAGATRADAGEIAQLREEVDGLKKTAQEFGKIIQAAQVKAAEAAIPTQLVPVAQWKNGGRDTAATAIETVLWAATGGDVDVLSQGLAFTPTARTKADAWFAQLSDATKAQYGSPEKLIALMIAKDAAAVSGMQILGQKEVTPDDVGMRVRIGAENGKTKDDTFFLHRSGNGWQLLLPDQAVEKFAKQLAGGK